MEKAIKKAIEGGYEPNYDCECQLPTTCDWHVEMEIVRSFLDPLFWQALGKQQGWRQDGAIRHGKAPKGDWYMYWHDFVDCLAEGKTADSFFEELLK